MLNLKLTQARHVSIIEAVLCPEDIYMTSASVCRHNSILNDANRRG